jgi:hypothetical protein
MQKKSCSGCENVEADRSLTGVSVDGVRWRKSMMEMSKRLTLDEMWKIFERLSWCWWKMMKTCDGSWRWLTDEVEEEEDTQCPRCARDVCWSSDSMRKGKRHVEKLLCAWQKGAAHDGRWSAHDEKELLMMMKTTDDDDGWDQWWWRRKTNDGRRNVKKDEMIFEKWSGGKEEELERKETSVLIYYYTKKSEFSPSNFTTNLTSDISLTGGKCPKWPPCSRVYSNWSVF